jgi:hypothetical protein
MMKRHLSEVAHFREQQALQEQSAQQGLSGLAIVATHASINARMEQGAERMLHLLQEGKLSEVVSLMERPDWGADMQETITLVQNSQES